MRIRKPPRDAFRMRPTTASRLPRSPGSRAARGYGAKLMPKRTLDAAAALYAPPKTDRKQRDDHED